MTPLEQHFQELKQKHPGADLATFPSGASLVVVPAIALPQGWSESLTEVTFLAPIGYPLSKPDCFWAPSTLRLSGGRMPGNTAIQPIPERGGSYLYFSWHALAWNPEGDTLLTYLRVIRARFEALQ
jgi:hypothetical protein